MESAPRPTVEAIRRHDAVVRAAWTSAPACLPLRFGQWVESRDTLEARLTEQRAELERGLARVAGAGEHGVRVVDPAETAKTEPQAPRPTSGKAYLERLQDKAHRQEERERRADAIGRELKAALAEVIRAQRLDPLPSGQGLVSVSHLVPREHEPEYTRRLRDFREEHAELGFVLTGPWPPYSFGP